jgi:hypothetical protein
MKEVTITFKPDDDGYYDDNELQRAIKADDVWACLWHIQQEIFRPASKHGYSDQELQKMVDGNPVGHEIIEKLEEKFLGILEERGINLDLYS